MTAKTKKRLPSSHRPADPTLNKSGFQYGVSKVMGKARPGYAGAVAGMRAVDTVRKMLRENFPERTMGTQSTRSKPKRRMAAPTVAMKAMPLASQIKLGYK